MAGNLLVFDNTDQALVVMDINKKVQSRSYKVHEKIRNPGVILGRNDTVSLNEFFGEFEHIINLETGEVTYSPNTVGTVVTSDSSRFYFDMVGTDFKQLYFENKAGKKKLSLFDSLRVPRGHVIGADFVSWFNRDEHRLIVYDTEGELYASVSVDCFDAIFLGEGENIFCITESGDPVMLDMNGQLLKMISEVGIKDGILSFSHKKNEIYLKDIRVSFSIDRFMREVVDVYAYNFKLDRLSLIGESVVGHGIGFNVLIH